MVTGLDIGSSKVAAVTARLGRDGAFEVIAQANAPSKGVARGMLVDLSAVVGSVSKLAGSNTGALAVYRAYVPAVPEALQSATAVYSCATRRM